MLFLSGLKACHIYIVSHRAGRNRLRVLGEEVAQWNI
jgi:hypothetical protein